MALTGNTDTFPLPDILRFLATTRKTGCLRLMTQTGSGAVFIELGAISALETSATLASTPITEKMFSLLRMGDGEFTFQSDVTTESSATTMVEPLLDQANSLIEQWPSISKVIPSLDVTIRLVPKLPTAAVTLRADQWAFVALIGGGVSVRALGAHLSMGEFAISHAIKELHDGGLVAIGAPAPATAAQVAHIAPIAQPAATPAPAPQLVTAQQASAPEKPAAVPTRLETIAAAAAAAMTPTVGAPADSVSFDPNAKPVEELIKDPWGGKPPAPTAIGAGSTAISAVSSDDQTQINRSRFFKLLQNAKQ